ncbi:MAG: RluA family pseudouridine synthase [Bacilli bacterium]|nr:RluA family pseudouridine synthase [Bacilli bacterium]
METIEVTESVKRIDGYLIEKLGVSRNKIQKMIEEKSILVNGKKVKNSTSLKTGDVITVEEQKEEEMNAEPENIPLDLVYEDSDIIIVNKENGMVVHPAVGNLHGTLVNALLYHSKNLSDINGEFRPGIVHRIDAFTTGLLVVAKNNHAHEILAKQLEEKSTHRKYIALVWGVIPNDTGTIDAPIGRDLSDRKKMAVVSGGKPSVTHFKVLERFPKATLIELQLETGRTHQIRVHMNYIGHPVVNDPVYGKRLKIDESGQCLHAKELGFIHPSSGEYMEFDSELPECFSKILNHFKDS